MPSHRSSSSTISSANRSAKVHRIEVFTAKDQADPIAQSLIRDAKGLGLDISRAHATRIYLLQGDLTPSQLDLIRHKLLADAVTERSISTDSAASNGTGHAYTNAQIIEVHPLPGVMDPVALSVHEAICELLDIAPASLDVATGWRYDIEGITSNQAQLLAQRVLANPVIQRVVFGPYLPNSFPVGTPHDQQRRFIPIRDLSDDQLNTLSRQAHLFLSLDEMQAIQSYYRSANRDPADIELETLAQTWSEHCVHKTLKSTITYASSLSPSSDPINWSNRPGHDLLPDGSILIHNLLKSTVAAATRALIADGVNWTLSVFVDNSGVIEFDDHTAVCVKVETHNHPSAIEPYGGAATGVGGCIRDVVATGLGASPIANTDVFCVAFPHDWNTDTHTHNTQRTQSLPPGTLHPRRILQQVVAGVRDYGNRMGIPTLSGAVAFDNRYVGNPLVYCGCIGVMPRSHVKGQVQRGDLIVAIGGRTGRDGIHGATFSSAELEHTAADEFAHAVQIGNAITQKRALDAIMRASGSKSPATTPLYHALTDCGAGGFSSAIGELGKSTGAIVHLDRAPLKYAGLSYTEIWISEAQERFVLAVPSSSLDALKTICAEEGAELAVLGEFTNPPGSTPDNPDNPDLQLLFRNQEVGRLSMHFMHEGIPTPRREAVWNPGSAQLPRSSADPRPPQSHTPSLSDALPAILAHPSVASKHWIIRQYDHEVKGNTVLRPLVGPSGRGPGDASIIQPVPGSPKGLAISCGLQTSLGDPLLAGDPYLMTLAAIDECVRNLVCVGTDPSRIAILDNFCWPSCKKPENLGSLVRAAEGCYDGALAYRTPFVSGKDSLNNQLTVTNPDGSTHTIEIPPTLLITGIGIVHHVANTISMDAKSPGNLLILLSGNINPRLSLRGSIYQQLFNPSNNSADPMMRVDLKSGPAAARAVHQLINAGLVHSAHDVSDGGLLTAVAEMLIGGSSPAKPIGASLTFQGSHSDAAELFAERPSSYILEIDSSKTTLDQIEQLIAAHPGVSFLILGELNSSGRLHLTASSGSTAAWPVESLAHAWRSTLDW